MVAPLQTVIWLADTHLFAALYFHGGNFTVGSKELLSQNYVEQLLGLGFVVVSANYRLCPTISVFDGPVTDALDAYGWAQDVLPGLLHKDAGVRVDSSKIVVLGHSAGGLLALLTVRSGERGIQRAPGVKCPTSMDTMYSVLIRNRHHTGWLPQTASSHIGLFRDEVPAGCIFPQAQCCLRKAPPLRQGIPRSSTRASSSPEQRSVSHDGQGPGLLQP